MTNEELRKSSRLAVLIDADNASARLVEPLLKEIARYGSVRVKKIYGDWTNQALKSWKFVLNDFALQPIQQFSYTTGKNSTDSALIIDAMDLLYSNKFDGFCIVSSDSDFTRLASRIRESGLAVYGFGEAKTPKAFVSACDKFIYTEILEKLEETKNNSEEVNTRKTELSEKTELSKQLEEPSVGSKSSFPEEILTLLKDVYENISGDNGWAFLGPLGSQIQTVFPSFDSRNYGYKKLSELIKATGLFEVKTVERKPGKSEPMIKLKSQTTNYD